MRQITESESTPQADGFYMPAEFAPQERVWMGWPNRPDTFAFGAVPAQRTYAGIANAISEFTPVVMCCNEDDYANCKAVFADNERVTVLEMSINDAWFRDTGATFLIDGKGNKAATDWHFNAYGGLVDGLYFPWEKDSQIAGKMADYSGVRTYRPDHVILEGGSITVDGEGTLIVTDWPQYARKYAAVSEELREYMTQELEKYLGVEKVIWVKEGIDPEVTNGHIDDCATFIAPGVVACIWTDDPDYPFYRQCHEIYETLSNAVDAKGRKLKVYKLPMPEKPCYMSEEEAASIDLVNPRTAQDEPQIASYMNYLVTNNACIVPQYGDKNDALAVETLQSIYDEVWGKDVFKCVGVDSRQVVYGGGNIHCITQQEPCA